MLTWHTTFHFSLVAELLSINQIKAGVNKQLQQFRADKNSMDTKIALVIA